MNQLNQIQKQQLSRRFTMYGAITEKISKEFREFANSIIENDNTQLQVNPYYKPDPVTIFLNTGGGYCDEGNAIISAINDLQRNGILVKIHTEGICMSMGIPILISGDIRTSDINTAFMLHPASCGSPSDYINKGIKLLEFQKKLAIKLENYIISRTNITQEIIDSYDKDAFWFEYEEAVKLGVLTHDTCKELEPTEDDLAIESLRSMTKQELKYYISKTQEVFEAKLEAELKKKKTDIFLVNTFESTINHCETFMGLIDKINDCNEIEDIYALELYDLISPAMIEGDSNEE